MSAPTPLTPASVAATAQSAGLPMAAETAQRVATALNPAFANFAPLMGTLPFDLEPAAFVAVQARAGQEKTAR